MDAKLQGADLRGANLQRGKLLAANLQSARLQDANLEGANLFEANLQGASLGGANLKEAEVMDANLQGANLRFSNLFGVALIDAKSLEGIYLYRANFEKTYLTKGQLGGAIGEEEEGTYDEAKEAYLALKNNFSQMGSYDDANWAYVKERQMEKMCSAPWRARRFYGTGQLGDVWEYDGHVWWKSGLPLFHPRALWFYARHTWKWLWDWIAELVCGYGESIFRTLGAMGVALVVFAVLYRVFGAVVDVSGNPSSTWLHCLLYSGGAFTTFGVDTLRPANDWIRALSIFESMWGIALTGLLGFVLGNRIRRA